MTADKLSEPQLEYRARAPRCCVVRAIKSHLEIAVRSIESASFSLAEFDFDLFCSCEQDRALLDRPYALRSTVNFRLCSSGSMPLISY
jgi:hypothetical protein